MKAEPEHLIDLMFDNKRQYQIPVYQRNYDWKKDNCIDVTVNEKINKKAQIKISNYAHLSSSIISLVL